MKKLIILTLFLFQVFWTAPAFSGISISGGGGGGDGTSTSLDTTNFDGNLGVGDTDVQTALETIDDISLGGDTAESNMDDAWDFARSGAISGTQTGIDVTYQDATDDVDFVVDVTPSAGSATLEISEDAIQVKYDSTDFQESTNGLYLGTDPTVAGSFTVDNILINGNDISSTAGTDLTITPLAGQQIVLDGTIVIDAGEVTGATSITSTAFVGALTGDVTGNVSGTAATVTGAAQANITSLGTLTTLTVDDITINANTISSAGASTLAITPTAGQAITLDGAVTVDAGVVAGITSLTTDLIVLTGADTPPSAANQLVYDNVVTGLDDGAISYFGGGDTVYYVLASDVLPVTNDHVLAYNSATDRLYWKEDADSGGTPAVITVADSTDTTSFPAFFESATGDLGPKTDASNFTYNATTGVLTAAGFAGALTGNVTGDITGNADTVTTNANLTGPITSVGNATTVAETELAAIAGLTFSDASIIQLTGAGAAAVLTSGGNNYFLASASDNSAIEFKTPANALAALGTTSSAAELDYLDIAALGTGAASKAVVLDGTGSYTAPTGTWNLSGVTGITLQAGEIVLADLAAGVYAKDIVTTSPVTGATDNVLVGADSDVTIALDFTATWDFGGATALEIPNGTTDPASTTGSIALDTDGDGSEFDGPMIVVSTSGATMGYIVTTAGLPGTAEDNYVIKYDQATDLVSWEPDDTGSALGGNLSSTNNDITTDNTIIQLEDSSTSENLTLTFSANTATFSSDSAVGVVDFGSLRLETDELDATSAALAIGDGSDDAITIDSTNWNISAAGAADFTDLKVVGAGAIFQLDGTDNWELRVDETGNTLEIGSSLGGVGDNVELEIGADGSVVATGALSGASVSDGTITLEGNGTITGLSEGGLPDSTITSADILDDTVDSADYAADSIDNEHINWADITNLDDQGMPIDFALTANATVADDITITFGTTDPWTIEGDTTSSALEFVTAEVAGTAITDPMFLIQADSGAVGMTADQIVFGIYRGTTKLFTVDEDGDVYNLGIEQGEASDDPYLLLDTTTTNDTDWYIGQDGDQDGTGDDRLEFRTNITAGSEVEMWLEENTDGEQGLHITGDIWVTGDDLYMNTNTANYFLASDGTNYQPTSVAGDVGLSVSGSTGTFTVTDLTITSEAQGDLLYRNATNWVRLGAGNSGEFLKTQGAAANPVWAEVTATPAGDDAPAGQIQYRVAGALAAEDAFYYTAGSDALFMTGSGAYIAIGDNPGDTAGDGIKLNNAATIVFEDATEAIISHVDDYGFSFNVDIEAADGNTDLVIRSDNEASDTIKLQAYDVDGVAYVDMITLTSHATDPTMTLAASGGITVSNDLALGANNLTMTGSLAATGSRVTKVWATDIESTNMPTVDGTAIDSTFAAISDVDVEMLTDVTGEGTAATYALFDDNDGTYSFRAIADGDIPDTITITAGSQIASGSPTFTAITSSSAEINGTITLQNDETISNATDGIIVMTGGVQRENPAASATDGYYDGDVRTFTVDSGQTETSFGQAYHVDTDGELIVADADVASQGSMPAIGLAVETGTGSKKILLRGLICETDWAWTVGGTVYVSADPATTEGLSQTAESTTGDTVQVVGIATTADCIEVNMGGFVWVEVP